MRGRKKGKKPHCSGCKHWKWIRYNELSGSPLVGYHQCDLFKTEYGYRYDNASDAYKYRCHGTYKNY
ncbi:MAG: hypothetical protein ACI4N3_01125 [Alphaproteobacteria bacterium]